MTGTRRRRIVLVAIGIVVVGLILALPVSVVTGDNVQVPSGANAVPVGPMFQGITVVQRFPAMGESISDISLRLATYQRVNRGTLRLTVQANTDGQWRDIAIQTVRKESLQDNAFQRFTFSPPLSVRKGQLLALRLEADSDPGQAITWWVNPQWTAPSYELLANGQRQPGTAEFSVQYGRVSGPLVRMLPLLWQRITIFLDPIWQGMLLLGMILTGSTLIASYICLGKGSLVQRR